MKKKFIMFLVASCFGVISCNVDDLAIKNQGSYDSSSYFATLTQINEAVTANYASLLDVGLYSRDIYYIYDALSNDAERNFPALGAEQQLTEFTHDAENALIKNQWKTLYRIVFRSNFVIEKANALTLTSDADKALRARYIAEAQFLRGWANFMLVNNWGRVPFRPTLESNSIFDMSRTDAATIWKSVETDFAASAAVLPAKYASAADRGRITAGAATAMLGKSYLFQKKWQQAQAEFQKLTAGQYELNPSYDEQFSKTNGSSKESIFDIPHRWSGWATGNKYYMFGGQEGWGGKTTHTGRAQEYGFNDWNNYLVSDASVKAFTYADESGKAYIDPRGKLTFYGNASEGGDDTYCDKCSSGIIKYDQKANGNKWRKYEPYEFQAKIGEPESEINTQVIRYADVLLMLAESQIQQGNTASALPLINQVRKRVGAFEYKSLGTQSEALDKLIRERRIELCGEQVRYFDLIRWGLFKSTINAEKNAVSKTGIYVGLKQNPVEDKHLLFPIPNSEITTNKTVAGDVANGWN
jgi:starch-binding outer membrane protein, SusD/RagB family